jgi:hypothetical protein
VSPGTGMSGDLFLVTFVLVDSKYFPYQTMHSSSWAPKQLKGNVARDLDSGSSRSALKIKRIEANDIMQYGGTNNSKGTNQTIEKRRQLPQDILSRCERIESFAKFQKLPIEIRHSIWKESLPEPRIFDDDTLRLLRPQHGVICLDLIPSILQVCDESRTLALRHLCRTVLFRTWLPNSGRMIYFNPKRDVYRCRFTDLLWRRDFTQGRGLFGCIEIIANASPEQLNDTIGYGHRSAEFHNEFPNLKRLILTDRYANLHGEVLRNGWPEEQWTRESKSNQRDWDRGWKSVLEFFEKRKILITTSSTMSETRSRQTVDIAHVPNAWREECVDTTLELIPSIFNLESPTPNTDIPPGAASSETVYRLEYWCADGSSEERFVTAESFAGKLPSLFVSQDTD